MATRAFILIETAVGKTRDVAAILTGLEGVQSADVVTGPYDIIAVLESSNMNSIGELLTGNVHSIPGVVRTVTCVAVGS